MARPRRERDAYAVVLDAADLGATERVGTLFRNEVRTALPASFEYAPPWLDSARAFMLDPRLELWRGEHHVAKGGSGFGVFMDSAPDRWGRVLLERREIVLARREGRPARTLQELDFLLGVHDHTRGGALRFRADTGGPFLDDRELPAPPATSLRELAAISARIEQPGIEKLPEYEQWLAMLLAPGSSLGGARPKASFTDDGALWIAKFPAHDDRIDVGAWEYVEHELARRAGIDVPPSRIERLGERYSTFCVARFDRGAGGARRMYASALTLLERERSEGASYVDLAELIANHGARDQVDADLGQLFRRVVFNVLAGNRDDHLRNHGFLREPSGWRLAPAFDLNPNPYRDHHVLALDGETTLPDLARVRATGDLYRLGKAAIERVVGEVRGAVSQWSAVAKGVGLSAVEIERMAGVFRPISL